MIHAKDLKAATVRDIIEQTSAAIVEVIMTDDSPLSVGARTDAEERAPDDQSLARICSWGRSHEHRGIGLLAAKRGIMGTWHRVSAKHLPAYLDEMCFRFNNRKNPYLFRDTIIKLIDSPNLEYKELTAQRTEPAA